MLMHSMAPGKVPPPELYARHTWVQGLGLTWDDLGGIDEDEIHLLVQMLNVRADAENVKAAGLKR